MWGHSRDWKSTGLFPADTSAWGRALGAVRWEKCFITPPAAAILPCALGRWCHFLCCLHRFIILCVTEERKSERDWSFPKASTMVTSSLITKMFQRFCVTNQQTSPNQFPTNIPKKHHKIVWLDLQASTRGLKQSFLLVWHLDLNESYTWAK